MKNLSIVLLLSLISFSFPFDFCLKAFRICSSDKPEVQIPSELIDKCIVYDDNEDCDQCKTGYAVSDDKESCIPFQNCIQLRNGNEYCNECYDGYYINEQGQCEKINRDNCIAIDNIGCSACILDLVQPTTDGQCILPTTLIEGCTRYDESGNCFRCSKGYRLNDNVCEFIECKSGDSIVSYCRICEVGYYLDHSDGNCVKFGEGKAHSNSYSKRNKIEYDLLLLLLVLLS